MDHDKSPDQFSPDLPPSPGHSNSPLSPGEMATMVANGSVSNMPGPLGPVSKRYRPAPAKTFQCRGYGECRMVFSRSEHLARHIRKHTGERPFSCHCSKQFSRLDNLRQHAQTVHADKQEQNERMMRDLTTLHATIAAQNKASSGRGSRRAAPVSTMASAGATNGGSPIHEETLVKQEEIGSLPMHQRPGTSTGYEGDLMYQSWETDERRANNGHNHSFRDPGQSFLAPSATSSSTAAAAAAQSHSFRGYNSGPNRPGSSSSRPPTSSGLTDPQHPRSLPPLAAVVSNSLSSASPPHQQPLSAHHQHHNQQQSQSLFPFPGSLELRRPSTATRPGTAPASASFFSSRPFSSSGSGLGNGGSQRPDLSLLHSGFGRSSSSGFSKEHNQHLQLGAAAAGYDSGASGEVPTSPGGHDSSPFFFSPPGLDPSPAATTTTTSPSGLHSSSGNPRKRAFAGPDGPFDDGAHGALRGGEPPGSSSGLGLADSGGYDYGSESRPQSRRLSVMELCNDADALAATARPSSSSFQRTEREQYVAGSGAFLLSAAAAAASASASAGGSGNAGYGYGYGGHGGGTSRPTTSSGLVSSTSTMHIYDRASPPPQPAAAPVFGRTSSSAAGATGAPGFGASSSGSGGNGYAELRGSGVYSATTTSFRSVSGPTATAAATTTTTPASPSSPTPTSSTGSGGSVLSSSTYRPTTYAQQYQFAHSPTFSTASASSAASYSPRSPVSDGSGSASPFSPYLQPRSPIHDAAAVSRARGDAGAGTQSSQQQQQLDGQVRIPVSPHAAASFGMRV